MLTKPEIHRLVDDAEPFQYMSMVGLRRPRASYMRRAIIAVLAAGCGLTLVGVLINHHLQMRDDAIRDSVQKAAAAQNEAFDIQIKQAQLAQPDHEQEVRMIEENIPLSALSFPKPRQNLIIDVAPAGHRGEETAAADQARLAHDSARQGDLNSALQYQRHAAELQPNNMLYRLELAILYDRLADIKSATSLYGQVLQAYGDHAPSLPGSLDIGSIERRMKYLISMAQK